MAILYVVATPIGNLEDISLRALRVLREVKLIAAEDTRKTRRLLNAYNIETPLTSYHEHSKRAKLDYLLGYLEKEDLALVSEAGMPGLSDPGYDLIVAAIEGGISVVSVPGPSAVSWSFSGAHCLSGVWVADRPICLRWILAPPQGTKATSSQLNI